MFELLSFIFLSFSIEDFNERNYKRSGGKNMATEYKIENRNLYIYLDGDLDHHLAKKIKYKCDIILKSYPIKDIEFDFTNSAFIDSSGIGVILRKIPLCTGDGRNVESQQYECISQKDHSYGRIASTDRRNIEKWEDKKCCI